LLEGSLSDCLNAFRGRMIDVFTGIPRWRWPSVATPKL
jgi:hypothetical protein